MPEHAVGTRDAMAVCPQGAARRREGAHARAATSSPAGGGSCPGCRSRRSTPSRPRTGTKTLAELFDGRSQLLVYHFMFGFGFRVDEQNPGCTGCSFVADHFDGVVPHLNGHDVTLVSESIAPLEQLQAYAARMGWAFPWVSSLGSDFRYDFGAAFTEEQQQNGADYNFEHVDQRVAAARGNERLRPPGRSGPSHLLDLRARRRAADGHLRVPRRGAARPQRGPAATPGPGGTVTTSTRPRRQVADDRAQDRNPGRVAGRARRAARGGEGAHAPQRRARPQAAGAPLGAGREGLRASRPSTGRRSLAELFDGRSQLLVYHFMFGPRYAAGCPVCSSIADTLAPQVVHLKARDTTLLLASRAPLEKLLAYRERMGWPHRLGLERRQRLQPRPRLPLTPRRS